MRPLELAQQYMDAFYGGSPIDSLSSILADDLIFKGPLFEFDSAKDYLDSLEKAPPKEVSYKILHRYEDKNAACLLYEFRKPGIHTVIAQHFETSNDRIVKILLVFDTTQFR